MTSTQAGVKHKPDTVYFTAVDEYNGEKFIFSLLTKTSEKVIKRRENAFHPISGQWLEAG
jgi:hypothetical protein